MAGPADLKAVLTVLDRSLKGPVWEMPPAPSEVTDPLLRRAIALAAEVRRLAARRVARLADEGAYLLPLLEWTVPIVGFRQIERERRQLSAWASGLVLERLFQAMGVAEN